MARCRIRPLQPPAIRWLSFEEREKRTQDSLIMRRVQHHRHARSPLLWEITVAAYTQVVRQENLRISFFVN